MIWVNWQVPLSWPRALINKDVFLLLECSLIIISYLIDKRRSSYWDSASLMPIASEGHNKDLYQVHLYV